MPLLHVLQLPLPPALTLPGELRMLSEEQILWWQPSPTLVCALCGETLPPHRQEDVNLFWETIVGLQRGLYGYLHHVCSAFEGDYIFCMETLSDVFRPPYEVRSLVGRALWEQIWGHWHGRPPRQTHQPAPQQLTIPGCTPYTRPGTVYILQAEGTSRVKIGRTSSTYQRVKALHTGSPFSLRILLEIVTQDAVALETRLHHQYAVYRCQGEWFDLPEDVLQALLLTDFGQGSA